MTEADETHLEGALQGATLAPEAIPVIDFGPFRSGDAVARQDIAKAIGRACQDIGFFYLANHGVSAALIEDTFAEAKRFFDQSDSKKREIAIEGSPHHRGYFALGGENLDPVKQRAVGDFKEGIKIGRHLDAEHPLVQAGVPLHGPDLWPEGLPGWREAMQAYFDRLGDLGHEIMRAFALALDLPETHFDAMLTLPMATLGPLHYPPQPGEVTEARLGAGAHSDFGCLTILAQDPAGGLQVRTRAGTWIDAPYIEGTFVVNVGDMMARWTNDRFASTPHRVINRSGRDRYSLPFFYDPDHDAPVVCLETCRSPDEAPRYPPTTGLQHLLDRIAETFDYRQDSKDTTG